MTKLRGWRIVAATAVLVAALVWGWGTQGAAIYQGAAAASGAATAAGAAAAGQKAAPAPAQPRARAAVAHADPMIAAFGRLSPANVSDAVDQIVGKRGFLAHDVRPYVAGAFVGRAVTSLVKAAPADQATPALAAKHSVEMIDAAKPGEVGVIVMEGSLDVAAMGGLMGTAAKSRGMAGMVLDGAVRDVAEIRALGLPVYARSVSPANAVGRYASVANQVPVDCAGVTITPGDIIVASEEGVVAVPKDRAADVLKRAEEIAARERKMIPLIKRFKSVAKAVEAFNWI
jgi:regulator of RNase E activity RraA